MDVVCHDMQKELKLKQGFCTWRPATRNQNMTGSDILCKLLFIAGIISCEPERLIRIACGVEDRVAAHAQIA